MQLLLDRESGVGVRIERSRITGVVSGQAGFARRRAAATSAHKYVPVLADVVVGDVVVTSGLDRIYPQGLMVGRVRSVKSGERALQGDPGRALRALRAPGGGDGGARAPEPALTRAAATGAEPEAAVKVFWTALALLAALLAAVGAEPRAARPGPHLRSLPARGGLLRPHGRRDPRHAGGGRGGLGAGRPLRRAACWASPGSPRCWSASGWALGSHALPPRRAGGPRCWCWSRPRSWTRCSSSALAASSTSQAYALSPLGLLVRARRERGRGRASSSSRGPAVCAGGAAAVRIYEDLRACSAAWRRPDVVVACRGAARRLLLAPAGGARQATSASWPRTTASAPCPSPPRAAPLFDRNGRILAENRSSFNVVLTTEHSDDLRRRAGAARRTLLAFDPAEVRERLDSAGPALPLGGGEGRRHRRGRGHGRGAAPGAAGGERGGGARCARTRWARRPPTPRPRGRGHGAAARDERLRRARAGHRGGPGRHRAAVQPRAHGPGRPAPHHREQPRGGGDGGRARAARGRAQPRPSPSTSTCRRRSRRPWPGQSGSVVALDPETGEILAIPLAARPTTPTRSPPGIEPAAGAELTHGPREAAHEPRHPGRSTPPGSTFKIVSALAALQEGVITPAHALPLPRLPRRLQHGLPLPQGGGPRHGRPDAGHRPVAATSTSTTSASASRSSASRRYAQACWASAAPTGIDLPHEAAGLFQDPEWKMRTQKARWFPAETVSVSIGQAMARDPRCSWRAWRPWWPTAGGWCGPTS